MKKIFILLIACLSLILVSCKKEDTSCITDLEATFNSDANLKVSFTFKPDSRLLKQCASSCGLKATCNNEEMAGLKYTFTESTLLSSENEYSLVYSLNTSYYNKDITIIAYIVVNNVEYDSESITVNAYELAKKLKDSEDEDLVKVANDIIEECEKQPIDEIKLSGNSNIIESSSEYYTVTSYNIDGSNYSANLSLNRKYDLTKLDDVVIKFNDKVVTGNVTKVEDELLVTFSYIDYNVYKISLELDDTKTSDSFENDKYSATLSNPDYDKVTIVITLKSEYVFASNFKLIYNDDEVNASKYKILDNVLTYTYEDPHWSPIY